MNDRRFVVTDALWKRLEEHLPGKTGDAGATAKDNRLFLEAIFWRVRTGSLWRDLPTGFGKWNSQFRRFRRWAKAGVFERLFNAMLDDPDLESALIDGTIVQVHQKASGAVEGEGIGPGNQFPRDGDSGSGHRALKGRLEELDARGAAAFVGDLIPRIKS